MSNVYEPDKCPNCGALGTAGDPHDPDCPLAPVYASLGGDKGTGTLKATQPDATRRPTLYERLDRIEEMLREALARKPVDPRPAVHRRIDELSDRVTRLEGMLKSRFSLDSAALDSHERRLERLTERLARLEDIEKSRAGRVDDGK